MQRNLIRVGVLGLLIAASVVLTDGHASVTQAETQEVAARWYHRARAGQLHYRATPAGRSTPHTVTPRTFRVG